MRFDVVRMEGTTCLARSVSHSAKYRPFTSGGETLIWPSRVIGFGMASGFTEIRTPGDLLQALAKAKEIEEAFEEVLHWKGFLTISDSETGRLLSTLARDSDAHGRLVDSLIRMVEPFAPTRREVRIAPIVIDGDDETQFLQKLLEAEDLAYYVYSEILDALARVDLQYIGGQRNAMEFRRVLGQLVSAERTHRQLVSHLLAARSSL